MIVPASSISNIGIATSPLVKGDGVMTYQGIELTHVPTRNLPAWNKSTIRRVAYNLFAVVALMAAAGIIASAYHSIEGARSNPRLESMGVKHFPTTFRGAPPTN